MARHSRGLRREEGGGSGCGSARVEADFFSAFSIFIQYPLIYWARYWDNYILKCSGRLKSCSWVM